MSDISEITDPALNFRESKKTVDHGTYRYSQITPIYSSASPVLSLTQVSNVSFEIPAKCLNFSKSYLTFELQGAAAANFTNYYTTGRAPIETISLQARSGEYLLNITNGFNNLGFATVLPCTSFAKWNSTDIVATAVTAAACNTTCNGTKRTTVSNPTAIKFLPSGDGAVAAIRFHLSLGDFAHTILACPNDLNFNQVLTLTIGLAGVNRISFISTTAVGGTPVATVQVPLVSNFFLQLAVETNESICKSLQALSMSGMTINIPYVYQFKYGLPAGTSSDSQQIRLNSSYGSKLLKVYNLWMNSAETGANTAYDPFDLTGFQVRSYLNNQALQDNSLEHAKNQIYLYQKDEYEGSAMSSSTDFAAWFSYIDNFTGCKPMDYKMCDAHIDGLDLSQEILYGVNASWTTGQTCARYIWCVVQRQLHISGSQIMIR